MALHVATKSIALCFVVALLVAALGAGRGEMTSLDVEPRVTVLDEPRPSLAPPAETLGPVANPTLRLRATGYNSHVAQTNGSPHVTATGTRTRFGVLAASRDLLHDELPYGSLVRIRDLGGYRGGGGEGHFQQVLDAQDIFVVEDTMHPRKREQVDVWFGDHASAVNWGVRAVEVEVIRYGYDGPHLDPDAASQPFEGRPVLTASVH